MVGLSLGITLNVTGQQSNRPLHEVIIFKSVANQDNIINTFISIDSAGNIYSQHKKTESSFDIKLFTKEINDYVTKDKIDKYPANNNLPPEAAFPELNKQATIVMVIFQDVEKEKSFINKTQYSWGKSLGKDETDYPLFKYLTEKEVVVLKKLLK